MKLVIVMTILGANGKQESTVNRCALWSRSISLELRRLNKRSKPIVNFVKKNLILLTFFFLEKNARPYSFFTTASQCVDSEIVCFPFLNFTVVKKNLIVMIMEIRWSVGARRGVALELGQTI